MKHIKLFEEYEDILDPMSRDMFGLNHTFTLHNGFVISGPYENSDEADKILKAINREIFRMDDDAYGSHKKVLERHREELEDLGYSWPEYNVGVIEYDDGAIRLYMDDQFEEIKDIDPKKDYTSEIYQRLKNMGADYVHGWEGMVPIEKFK